MGKVRTRSLKSSMTMTFMITICAIAVLSAITIFIANRLQQNILKKRNVTISSPDFQMDANTGNYVFAIDGDHVTWQPLSRGDMILYYGTYVVMIGFPLLYMTVGIGTAAAIFYRRKLRLPLMQLQEGVEKIQEDDLDFHIAYKGEDELGRLCVSMEKMRSDLRQKYKALWEALEQRKLLNASVSHDVRTPLTVLKGYLEYLEKNALWGKLTEDVLLDTIVSMQGAVSRLEQYVDCVRDIEKMDYIEIEKQSENVDNLLEEIRSDVQRLDTTKEIFISSDLTVDEIYLDKVVFFRILENLLQNALRYARKQVCIRLSQQKNFLILTVEDDGKGFADKDLEKATGEFFSSDQDGKHFGIGLSICRLLCDKHGGSLELSNNKRGACVRAKLHIL